MNKLRNLYAVKFSALLNICLFALLVTVPKAHGLVAPTASPLASLESGIRTPIRLTTDSAGNSYVSNIGAEGVIVFDNVGAKLRVFKTAKKVFGVAIAANGDLLAAQGDSVAVFSLATGAQVKTIGPFTGSNAFLSANGIAVDGGGNIYVTDTLNSCIQVFNSTYVPIAVAAASIGKPSNSFGTFGRASGQFIQPTGIAYEKLSNQLAIVDSATGQIQFYTTAGGFVKSFGSFGAGQLKFTSPQSVAFEYSADGKTLNRIYVADSFQSNVQVVDATTTPWTYLSTIGGYGTSGGKLVTPGDVLFDAFDPGNNRLLVASGSGQVNRYAIGMITGTCGPANGGSFTTAPVAGLCSNGTVSSYSGAGPWSWVCAGQSGGASSPLCAAQSSALQRLTVNVTALNNSGGSVTSNPAGITCTSGQCSADFTTGNSVTLMPTASAGSFFSGWTGDCVSIDLATGYCTATMSANRSVTATFDLIPKARVAGIPYGTLTSALNAISVSGTLEAQALTFTENLVANTGTLVTIRGGYDAAYTTQPGNTTLQGTLTISSGQVIVDRLVIK